MGRKKPVDRINGPTKPKAQKKLNPRQVLTAQLMAARDALLQKSGLLTERQGRIAELTKKNAELEDRISKLEPVVFAVERDGIAAGNREAASAVGLPAVFKVNQTPEGWFLEK